MDDGALAYECAVIGAGPAGLTAALYLARFRRSVVVFDGGRSRAQWIPESHNCPGFPGGISGEALLTRLRAQLSGYEVPLRATRVRELKKQDDRFVLVGDDGFDFTARKVLLATGIVDQLPNTDWVEAAIQVGALRLCPVCDGFEVSDRRIAAYGPASATLPHAAFLRTYSSDVTLVCSDAQSLESAEAERAAALGVRVIAEPRSLAFDGQRCVFATGDAMFEAFDSVYAFLGCDAQSDLARRLGAESDDAGQLRVGRDQMTSVEGLYAAGDVVSALHQISVAVGHSGVAASAMHRALGRNLRHRPGEAMATSNSSGQAAP
jgi:thioredoxin reductase (NADPH)